MNKHIHRLLNNSGMTLVEVMIAVFILSIGIMGTLAYFTTAKTAVRLARDKTTATVHAEYILEDMRAKTTLAEITTTDWDDFVTDAGLNTLDNEAITVAFVDEEADPLNITVTVTWTTGTLAGNISLVTELTK